MAPVMMRVTLAVILCHTLIANRWWLFYLRRQYECFQFFVDTEYVQI